MGTPTPNLKSYVQEPSAAARYRAFPPRNFILGTGTSQGRTCQGIFQVCVYGCRMCGRGMVGTFAGGYDVAMIGSVETSFFLLILEGGLKKNGARVEVEDRRGGSCRRPRPSQSRPRPVAPKIPRGVPVR